MSRCWLRDLTTEVTRTRRNFSRTTIAGGEDMDKCFFDRGGECLALEIKKCDGCKFYKDYLTFDREREKSQKFCNRKI